VIKLIGADMQAPAARFSHRYLRVEIQTIEGSRTRMVQLMRKYPRLSSIAEQ
jgi:hypothetical protein